MVAFDGAHLFAVFFEFVKVQLVAGGGAVLDIQPVAYGFDKEVDDHWFGGGVGVESPSSRPALAYLGFAGAGVEV